MTTTERDDGPAVVSDLLRRARHGAPSDLGSLVTEHAARLGLHHAAMWLADVQHRVLVPFGVLGDPGDEGLSVNGTLAGLAYRTTEVLRAGSESPSAVWVPLLDRADTLGVLGGDVERWDEGLADDLLLLGNAVAALVALYSPTTDLVLQTRRLEPASIAAEVQWALLPPLAFASRQATICGALEPAYDIGGDSLDYAVDEGVAHLAVFDAKGHGLNATMLVSAAMGAYRHARRTGRSLAETYDLIDQMVSSQFGPESFVTGFVAQLDLERGELSYLMAGHHPALVLRGGTVVRHLAAGAHLPFGLTSTLGMDGGPGAEDGAQRESLEPGDRVVLFTDGVIEARDPSGGFFGLDRLQELLVRADAATAPVPETVRRVIHTVLEHQDDRLQDDATLLMVEWHHDS